MKAYTVVRSFATRTGAVFQVNVRSYETEAKAQEAAEMRQMEFDAMLDAVLVHRDNAGGGHVAGKLLDFMYDLGFKGVKHSVVWSEVTDTDLVVAEKSVLLTGHH